MAYVITVALHKGGVGKTTVAVALGSAAAAAGIPVTVIDADPMGSAVRWSALADQAGRPLQATIVGMPVQDISRRIHSISRDSKVVIIDAPPPGALGIARAAIEAASLVVMPCPPRLADLDRVVSTTDDAHRSGVPARAVLTQVRSGLAELDAAADFLKQQGVTLYDTSLPMTVSVQRAYGQALASGPLMRFGVDLLAEIIDKEMNDRG
jgi:chromosome partitioning protein